MKKIAIESSAISNIGYGIQFETLYVEFKNGKIYRYDNVKPAVVLDMIFSSSAGKYFNLYIRNIYDYKKVNEWPEI